MPSARIMTGGNRLSTIPYGDKWRRMRKAAHAELNAANVKQYNFVVNFQSHRLLQDLTDRPDDYYTLAREFATGVVIRAVYDLDTGKTSHPLVKNIKGHSSTIITTFTPGQALIDLIRKFALSGCALEKSVLTESIQSAIAPLQYLPKWIGGEKRAALEVRAATKQLNEAMRTWLQERKATRPTSCFLAGLLDNEEGSHLSLEEKDWLAGQLLGAGSETVSSTPSCLESTNSSLSLTEEC